MSTKSYFAPGQLAIKLAKAFEAGGGTPEEINGLSEYPELISRILSVCRGTHEICSINPTKHLIDCDANPFCPEGLKVKEHQKAGALKVDFNDIILFLTPEQHRGCSVVGHEFFEIVKDKSVLNANVLDYLLKHPELVPKSWIGKYILFFGTIYVDDCDDLAVRYLFWNFKMRHDYAFFADIHDNYCPAALLKV